MATQHDFRQNKGQPGVEMIVRPRNRYGSAVEGETVLVDAKELRCGSTRAACMTREEAIELNRKLAEAQKSAEKRQKLASRRSISAMINQGLMRLGKTSEELAEMDPDPELAAAAEAAASRATNDLVETVEKAPSVSLEDSDELPADSLPAKKKRSKR